MKHLAKVLAWLLVSALVAFWLLGLLFIIFVVFWVSQPIAYGLLFILTASMVYLMYRLHQYQPDNDWPQDWSKDGDKDV